MIYISIGFLITEEAETFYSLVKQKRKRWLVFPAQIILVRMESDFVIRINTNDILAFGVERGSIQNRRGEASTQEPCRSQVLQRA